MFEHKVDDHTTYIICDPDTAAWYNIFWLIGAIIKLCIFVAAALFAPVSERLVQKKLSAEKALVREKQVMLY